jgi:hypothetical protein
MLFISFFCPPPYVTDTGTIPFALFSTSVCKTYVKKTNPRMLNFWDTRSLKFKYSASLILNLYIAGLLVLFVGHGITKTRFSSPQPENPRSKKCLSQKATFLKKTNSGIIFVSYFSPPAYVTDVGTIYLFFTPAAYVKRKTDSGMLNLFDTSAFNFKEFTSLFVNLYIAELYGLFVGHGTTEAQFSARQIENLPFKNSSPQSSMSICISRNSWWYL